MRYFLFPVMLLAFCTQLSAQSIGPDFDKINASTSPIQEVVPLAEGGFVALIVDNPADPRVLSLRYFDEGQELREERQLVLSDDGLPAQVEGAFRWGEHLAVLTSIYYPGPQRNNLILRKYSVPDLEEISATFVDEAYTPADLRIPFGFSLSPDSTRLLCYAWSYSAPETNARLKLSVYDRELNLLWDKLYILPYKNETFYLYGALFDETGHAYVLCEDYQGAVSRYGDVNERKIKQIILYAGERLDQPKEYAVQPGKLILSGIRFRLAPGGGIIGAGFYRERNRTWFDGLITLTIDGAANRIDHHLLPIEKSEYKDQATLPDGFRPNRANQYPFAYFTVDHLLLGDDDAFYLIGEQIVEDPGSYTPYEFNDILIARISQGRRLDWFRRLPKRQQGFFELLRTFSYSVYERDEHLLFLYNNVDLGSSVSRNRISLDLRLSEVTPSGDVRRRSLSQTNAIPALKELAPLPARTWKLGTDRILVTALRQEEDDSKTLLVPLSWQRLLSAKETVRGN